MKTLKFDSQEAWLEARRTKITGSRLANVVCVGGPTKDMIVKELEAHQIEFKKAAKKEELEVLLPEASKITLLSQLDKKIGYYELIAERIALPPNGDNPMDRGHELEAEAIERFIAETGKAVKADLVIWAREDDESIAVSPDGCFLDDTEAVEVKCLSSARHVEALLTQQIPDEYQFQKLQYFIVNDKLQKLHFCFYDPRLSVKDFFWITIERKDVEQEIATYLAYQKMILQEVNEIVNKLTF